MSAKALSTVTIDAYNPGPMTGRGNQTYLLASERGAATLIDAGTGDPRHLSDLDVALRRLHASLTCVLVTHGHADHASGAPALARAHAGARFHKVQWPAEDDRHPVDWRPLVEGQVFELPSGEPIEVVHTPGHSPDHVVFWQPATATLFSGDLVLPGGRVVIQWSRGGNMRQYLDGIRRVIALRPARLLPAHGPEVHDPIGLLTMALDHRLAREQQVFDAVAAGRSTVEAIVESIYDELAPPLAGAAGENVRAHLEKLRDEGRAFEHDGRWQP